ncbi:MAG: hypothetical protein M9894_04115 [Planctomycetes bacterium]|nr:hypothetical protein [Planctomycetota bacterium]
MSDERLRELERRWRQGGRPDDRLRWWSARARAGDLPAGADLLVARVAGGALAAERVELAAYLGDARARALALEEVVERVAYGGDPGAMRVVFDAPDLRLDDVLGWVGGLALWEPGAVERALLAATRDAAARDARQDLSATEDEREPWLHGWREVERERRLAAAQAGLETLERWVEGRARPDDDPLPPAVQAPHLGPLVMAVTIAARFVLARRAPRAVRPEGREDLREWRDALRDTVPDPRDVRDAVRVALVPWALGEVLDADRGEAGP